MRECDGGSHTRPRLPRLATAAPERQSGLQITVRSNCNAAQTKKVLSILHTPSLTQSASPQASHQAIPAFPSTKPSLGEAIVHGCDAWW